MSDNGNLEGQRLRDLDLHAGAEFLGNHYAVNIVVDLFHFSDGSTRNIRVGVLFDDIAKRAKYFKVEPVPAQEPVRTLVAFNELVEVLSVDPVRRCEVSEHRIWLFGSPDAGIATTSSAPAALPRTQFHIAQSHDRCSSNLPKVILLLLLDCDYEIAALEPNPLLEFRCVEELNARAILQQHLTPTTKLVVRVEDATNRLWEIGKRLAEEYVVTEHDIVVAASGKPFHIGLEARRHPIVELPVFFVVTRQVIARNNVKAVCELAEGRKLGLASRTMPEIVTTEEQQVYRKTQSLQHANRREDTFPMTFRRRQRRERRDTEGSTHSKLRG